MYRIRTLHRADCPQTMNHLGDQIEVSKEDGITASIKRRESKQMRHINSVIDIRRPTVTYPANRLLGTPLAAYLELAKV